MFQFTVNKLTSVLLRNPTDLTNGAILIFYTLANFILLGACEYPPSHLRHSLNTRCFLRHFFTQIPYAFKISSISANFCILHFTFFFVMLLLQMLEHPVHSLNFQD